MKRKHISLKTKLAAALGQLFYIPWSHTSRMHEDQLIGLFELDHHKPHAEEGGDHHSNLVWMWASYHREYTAKVTVPQIAKNKRVKRLQDEHVNRLLAKDRGEPRPRSRWPKGRKLAGRPFRRQHA